MRVPHDLRLVPAAALAWGGAAWWVSAGSTVPLVVAAVGLLVVALVRRPVVALTACCVVLVAVSCAWRVAKVEASPLAQAADDGWSGTFEVSVRRDARVFSQHGQEQSVVELTVRRATIAGRSFAVSDRVTAFVEGASSDLVVGRHLTVAGRLAPSDGTREVAVIDVARRGPVLEASRAWEVAERMRAGVRTAVEPQPPAPRALLPALVDGDDARMSEDLEADFQRSGLTHLTAVSGTNLTIVLGVVLAVARLAGARRGTTWLLGALTVAAFVLVARPDPSVVRAAAMGVVGIAGLGFGSRGGVRALAVAVVALLVIDPWLSRTAGFILSVVATAGILVLGPPLTERFARWMPRWCAIAVAVPLAAQLACTPPLAAISGEVSLVAVAANLLAGPVVAPATVLGLLGGLVAVLVPVAGQVIAYPGGWCAAWIVAVARRCADLDGASIGWPSAWQLLLVVVPALVLVALVAATRPVVAVGLTLGLTFGMLWPPSPGWPPEGWVAIACDVGQGDATVLAAGPSSAVVVDAGPDPTLVDRCLDRLGVRSVPAAVLTHAHADHVAGWPGVAEGRGTGTVLVGPTGPAGQRVSAGDRFTVGAVDLEVLWAGASDVTVSPDQVLEGEGSVLNDASVVVRARVGGVSLLLTGDVEPDAQDSILRSGVDVRADVLKMPHHGSSRQSEHFFEAVAPRVATISAGVDNDYGHPAPAALRLLRDLGTRAHRTDLEGDIALVVRDGRLAVVTRR